MKIFVILVNMLISMPSVLWCCWLGGRKGIWSVKNLGVFVGVGVLLVRLGWRLPGLYLCLHYLPLLHKNPEDRRLGNPAWTQHSPMLRQKADCFFWYRFTRVVPEQRLLNGCCCCCCCCCVVSILLVTGYRLIQKYSVQCDFVMCPIFILLNDHIM